MVFPVRPNPAMMTWPFRSSTSSSFGCMLCTVFCGIISLSLLPNSARYGVIAIVNTTARFSCVASVALNNPTRTDSANVTKANSPPGPTYILARNEFTSDIPNSGPARHMTAILPIKSAAVIPRILPALWMKVAASIVMPTVMKNKPRRRPLNGAMSLSTCKWNSVSARSRPAKNAPSSIDRPSAWVRRAVPSATKSVVALKSSA
ncbi:hypothetical protein BE221DRAFT_73985 [Ostreococcus tauri]|uniref:Uncharacterized protein n=1 Tax=Ostreococcus tauri TaxID=70448 RepID=A0A1Y5IDE9_OSTTA|nr:hypothetical protein BE221DRAFT_73985 [Ostreococcus tauri]